MMKNSHQTFGVADCRATQEKCEVYVHSTFLYVSRGGGGADLDSFCRRKAAHGVWSRALPSTHSSSPGLSDLKESFADRMLSQAQ